MIDTDEQTEIWTALITPFEDGGALDVAGLRQLTERQTAAGIKGLCILGGTGEPYSLTSSEKRQIVSTVAEVVAGEVPIVVGALVGPMDDLIELVRFAEAAGAAGIMAMPPVFVMPDTRAIEFHLECLSNATGLPLVLFNSPGRSGVVLDADQQLSLIDRFDSIRAVKEGSGDLGIALSVARREAATVFQGIEHLLLSSHRLGIRKAMVAGSNLVPTELKSLVECCDQARWSDATELDSQLGKFWKALYREPNPAPLKYLMLRRGLIQSDFVRPPLRPPSNALRKELDDLLKSELGREMLGRAGA